MQEQQPLPDSLMQPYAQPAGSPSSDDFFSASVGASPLSDSDMNSFKLPAEQAGKTASSFDSNPFDLNSQDDASGSLAWSQFLLPESSYTWTQPDQHTSWQPAGLPGPSAFAGQAALRKQSPVEAVQDGSTPRSSEDSAEGCLLTFQGSLNSASDPTDTLGLSHDIRQACKNAVPMQHSSQQSAGQSEELAALVTTGSIKSAPYGKRTLKTAEERKAHRMAKNRATAAASRKRKQEAAHELVQRQERLSRENHELLELLQGREAQIVELRRRIAAAESRTPNAWSPPASSDPTSDPISDPIDLYWQF